MVALGALLAFTGAAQAAPHAMPLTSGRRLSMLSSLGPAPTLLYYGGPVIPNAKVYAVFWGETVSPETKARIGPFYANILDSGYMDWLSQYDTDITAVDGRRGTNQKIGRGTFAGAITILPASASLSVTNAMIQGELEAQIAAGKLPAPDENTLFMLHFPAGVGVSYESAPGETARSCVDFCAYHDGFQAPRTGASIFYGVMPVCEQGCGGSDSDSLSVAASHEMIEAVTDPFPTPGDKPAYPQAWNTSAGSEISDLCAAGSSTVTGHGIVSRVSWQWDNAAGACAKGPWTQSRTPAAVAPGFVSWATVRPNPLPLWEGALRAGTATFWK